MTTPQPKFSVGQRVLLKEGGDAYDGKPCVVKKRVKMLGTYQYRLSCDGVGVEWFYEDDIREAVSDDEQR